MAGAKVSRKEQGEQTRRAIVQAAVELYAEAGVRGTGLIDIGERAGVSHATIFYHFGSSKGPTVTSTTGLAALPSLISERKV
jgi:AcrR family transcriptional regulator